MVKLRRYSKSDIWRRLSMPVLYSKHEDVLEKVGDNHLNHYQNEGNDNVNVNGNGNHSEKNFENIHRTHNKRRIFSSNLSLHWPLNHDNVKSTSTTSEDIDDKIKCSATSAAILNDRLTSNHSVINQANRHAFKQISKSIPTMTQAHSVTRGPADPDGSVGAPLNTKTLETIEFVQTPGSSKARQKKFHRHFKQVGNEERVLNYYSCALVGDILLQGHLYITKNYFAFYSNVFGYVTKLLIPTVDVLKVSKEKTARIIPNAVGISTEDEKHVFGSLLSRDSTYKLMVQVWKAANSRDETAEITVPKIIKNDIEDSASGELLLDDDSSASASGNEDTTSVTPVPLQTVTKTETLQNLIPKVKKSGILTIPVPPDSPQQYWSLAHPSIVLTISTALLISLFLSAGFLLYRISKIQNTFYDFPLVPTSGEMYQDIFKWQSILHSRSANEMHEFLNKHLNQIEKVRLSLEALSMLIYTGNDKHDQYYQENHYNDEKGKPVKDDSRNLPNENSK